MTNRATDAAGIAAKLSGPQRDAVLFDLRGYFDPNTIRALRAKGLYANARLTPLGIEVRAHLKAKP